MKKRRKMRRDQNNGIQWMSEIRTFGFRRFRKVSGSQNVQISDVLSEIRTKMAGIQTFTFGFQTKRLKSGHYVRYSDICNFRRVRKPDVRYSDIYCKCLKTEPRSLDYGHFLLNNTILYIKILFYK